MWSDGEPGSDFAQAQGLGLDWSRLEGKIVAGLGRMMYSYHPSPGGRKQAKEIYGKLYPASFIFAPTALLSVLIGDGMPKLTDYPDKPHFHY